MGRIVMVALKPKRGCEAVLDALTAEHLPMLRREGLVTDRAGFIMRASDGTVIEVFEWVSGEAISAAHENESVQSMWRRYAEVCDYIPIGEVPEAAELFSEFTPVDV